MDSHCQNLDLNTKYLLSQLNIARKEINNLRQQMKALRYIHEKDVENIRHLLEARQNTIIHPETRIISSDEVKPGTSMDGDILRFKPIGVISTWFPNKRGTPRQPGICSKAPGQLTLYNSIFTNPEHALIGLHGFSHMWILFHFHKNDSTHIRAKVAPPRLNGIRTGVFSTRSPHRPCPIGLSLVKIIKIEDHTIYFEGVDMVDQTPVLDIKPYIPLYDSPMYIEQFINRQRERDRTDVDATELVDESRNVHLNDLDSMSEFYQNNEREMTQDESISRDEEIALRLQVEEFQGSANFENYNSSRNIFPCADLNPEDSSGISDNSSFHRVIYPTRQNSEAHGENIRTVSDNLQSMNLNVHNNTESNLVSRIDDDSSSLEANASRTSRLLDGADGPSTICSTDLDLTQRHSLNSRIDNSPIRMGIREAPDGEEGLQTQTLIPSQTVPNTPVDRVTSEPSTELINNSEVRIPEWISRPRSSTLSVVFNDRALIQLNEILEDKAEEKKSAIENVLREDPRSVYLRQRWGNQFYTFLIHDLHITCRFDDNRKIVTVLQIRHAGRTCECGEPEWQCLGHSPSS